MRYRGRRNREVRWQAARTVHGRIGPRYLTKVPRAVTGSPGSRFVVSATAMGNAARERIAHGIQLRLRHGYATRVCRKVSRHEAGAWLRSDATRGVTLRQEVAREAFGAVCQTNTAPHFRPA